MEKGFLVEYEDGKVITEEQMEWNKVPKAKIKKLVMKWHNKSWEVPGPHCFQFKRASAPMYGPSVHKLEARVIGYFEGKDN